MTRLWRAAVVGLVAATLLVGPSAAAFATMGDTDGRGGGPGDRVTDRPVDRPSDTRTDVDRDRVIDRLRDAEVDRPSDRARDGVRDRVRRPVCDPDRVTDRIHDCRPHHEIRPAIARCIHYIETHTDHTVRRNLRWLWRVCHRLAWNHNNPE